MKPILVSFTQTFFNNKEDFFASKVCATKKLALDGSAGTFTEKLELKGFKFNEEQKWYQRTWTTPLPVGIASCLEVYREDPEGEWTAIMYGGDGGIFYEHKVSGTPDKNT